MTDRYRETVSPEPGYVKPERDLREEADHIAAVAEAVVGALVAKNFSPEAAVYLCGKVLEKMSN